MKKFNSALLLLTLLLSACSSSKAATESVATQNQSMEPATSAAEAPASTKSVVTESAIPAREALISEIQNAVSVRLSSDEGPAPASVGISIGTGGGIETGSDGRARLDLLPEGTIVRVGPNSSFTVPELVDVDGKPKTTIDLFFGKVYILLNGGSLDVKTPSGVASVRGSVLSVSYNPETNRIEASCLEGHCTLEDEDGREVELTDGEESHIDPGEPPTDPEEIDNVEIQEWLDVVPEMSDFFEELPNPEDYPEPGPDDVPFYDELLGEIPTNAPTLDSGSSLPTDAPTEVPTDVPTDAPTEPPVIP